VEIAKNVSLMALYAHYILAKMKILNVIFMICLGSPLNLNKKKEKKDSTLNFIF
jgi:hypothetical protein